MGNQEERKHRRFQLEVPVCLTFQAGNSAVEIETISQNISIGGLLVKSAVMIPVHTPVTFIMSVQVEEAVHPIYLAAEGKVVRAEKSRYAATFVIAVECRATIMQLEEHLPPA